MLFEAIFQPLETRNYNPAVKDLAGKKVAVQDGPFKDQQCFYIPNSRIGWIPECDLKELKPVPFVKWKEILKNTGFGEKIKK